MISSVSGRSMRTRLLDDGGQGEQYQRQDAQEHVFKVPVEKLGHHGQDDQDSKNDVDGDHRFFPLQLFPQLTPHPGSFAGIFWPHLYLPFYIIYCYSIAVSGTKSRKPGRRPVAVPLCLGLPEQRAKVRIMKKGWQSCYLMV